MRSVIAGVAALAAAMLACSNNIAFGQQAGLAPFDPYAPPVPVPMQTATVDAATAARERQMATMADVERLKAQMRLLELRVTALETGAASGTPAAQQLVPSLDDVIENHRVPPNELGEHPVGQRLLFEKWYNHGVFFCDYDPAPRAGEPVSFASSSRVKQASEQASTALSRAGASVYPAIVRDPDLPVHRVCFDTNWSGTANDLRRLQELENVVLLCFYYTGLSDADVKHLQPLTALTDLDLRHTGISDQALATLAQLKSLRRLTLAEENVTLQGVHTLLEQLPKIRQVRLDATYMALDIQQEMWLYKTHSDVEFVIRRQW